MNWPVIDAEYPTAAPATIVAAGNWASGIIPMREQKSLAVGAKLTRAGTLTVQRYADAAKAVPVGAAVAATLTANVANSVLVDDGAPSWGFEITVANTDGSNAGTLSGVSAIRGA